MTVDVEDAYGNIVTSNTSTVTLTLSSGTFAGGSSTATATASGGVATFSSLVVDTAGTYTVAGTDGTLTATGASSNFTIAAAAVSKLVFTTTPAGATAGGAFTTQPVVKTEDTYGNPSTSGLPASDTVTIAIASGSGTLLGTTTYNIGTSGSDGTITGSGLQINQAASFTLSAAASGLTTGDSSAFTVSPAAASKLVFNQQPTGATAGATISPAVTVDVEDAYGNIVTSNSSTVTLTLSSGTFAGGSSTSTATASAGVATFSSLVVDTAGTYTVAGTDGTLTATGASSNFTIAAAAVSKLVFTTTPAGATAVVRYHATGSEDRRYLRQSLDVGPAGKRHRDNRHRDRHGHAAGDDHLQHWHGFGRRHDHGERPANQPGGQFYPQCGG